MMRQMSVVLFLSFASSGVLAGSSPWQCSGVIANGRGFLAMSDDFLAIGESEGMDFYRLSGDSWAWTQRIDCPPLLGFPSYSFCTSLAMSDDVCVVAAPDPGRMGYVFVYRLRDGQWIEEQVIADANLYGTDVRIQGDVFTIESNWGAAIDVYRFDGQRWQLDCRIAGGTARVHEDRCVVLQAEWAYPEYISELCVYRFDGVLWNEEEVLDLPYDVYPHNYDFHGNRLAVVGEDAR